MKLSSASIPAVVLTGWKSPPACPPTCRLSWSMKTISTSQRPPRAGAAEQGLGRRDLVQETDRQTELARQAGELVAALQLEGRDRLRHRPAHALEAAAEAAAIGEVVEEVDLTFPAAGGDVADRRHRDHPGDRRPAAVGRPLEGRPPGGPAA